jgi:flagellar hook-basal body complex protein FliE
MAIYRAELVGFGMKPEFQLNLTHPNHRAPKLANFQSQGSRINEINKRTGAEMVIRSGTFMESMLGALDKVSAYQQFASSMNQALLLDPDSVDPHDVTIAQAEASMSLNITRNVLNRIVQGWRDLINTR